MIQSVVEDRPDLLLAAFVKEKHLSRLCQTSQSVKLRMYSNDAINEVDLTVNLQI